jgi:hypothetical protein
MTPHPIRQPTRHPVLQSTAVIRLRALPLLAVLAAAACSSQALALSYCASDGTRAPVALVERFISADCEACWADPATPVPRQNVLALDWVVPSSKPGAQADDAPLSAVATRDASDRLDALGERLADDRLTRQSTVQSNPALKLRVAHGLPVNDYVGTSIETRPAGALRGRGEVTAWLLLVETIPAGAEGTPVERNLVRNAFKSTRNGADVLSKAEQARWYESRPMHVADGAKAVRLRVVGWLQDARGRVLAAAASRCLPSK